MKYNIAAFSRRFPPNWKRRWYIIRYKGKYIVRCNGRTIKKKHDTLNSALDAMMTDKKS